MSEKLNGILEAARLHAEEVILPHVDDWNIAKLGPVLVLTRQVLQALWGYTRPKHLEGRAYPYQRVYESMNS